MPRATKIVATLGPASNSPDVLERMIRAGVDVVRMNFSHGKAQDHIDRATLVREIAKRCGKEVAIMADLQGPKIRVGKFEGDKTLLEPGQRFILDGATTDLGNNERVGLDYKELPRDVKAGNVLLLNDGLLVLVVDDVRGEQVHTTVKVGGVLSNNKGINKQGGGLTAPALTGKDMEDIKTAMSFQCEYLAVSFPKNATDMEMARQLANVAGEPWRHKPGLIAKIERSEAIPVLESIVRASDGIMVASRMNFCPGSSSVLSPSNLPTRIFGPCRSAMIATSRPTRFATSRTSVTRSMWSCALPCEKFMRTTSTPARIIRSSTSGELDAGPRVATILVARGMAISICIFENELSKRAGRIAAGAGMTLMRSAGRAALKNLESRQGLALEHFEKRTTAGRDVAHVFFNAVLGDRGQRVATARDAERG